MNVSNNIKIFDKTIINSFFERYNITDHPLISAISQLNLTQDQISVIALNIYHVVKNFPRFLSAIITNIGNHETCMDLVDNLYEEYGRMNKERVHLYTYRQFIKQLGIETNAIDAFTPHISVVAYVRNVIDLCLHYPYREGLAALGVIEDIVHQVSNIIGITVNKEQISDAYVFHFDEHKVLDKQHANELYRLLDYENDEQFQQIERGLELGFYYHLKLYSDIYQQAINVHILIDALDSPELQPTNTIIEYPLSVGESGEKRLSILNRLYNRNSITLIKRFIEKSTCSILDIGCGTGQLAYELSQQTCAEITAIDNSLEQINMAQRTYGHHNIRFKCLDAASIKQLSKTYDIIYLRWVLIYLPEAKAVINACYEQLSPNGVLIIEDNDVCFSGCSSPDKMDLISDWEKIWQKGIHTISGNTSLSSLVHNALQELKMNDLSYSASQSVLEKMADKLLFSLGIEESRNAFLSLGFDNKLVDKLRDKFAQIALSPYPVFFVRNFQISARKTV